MKELIRSRKSVRTFDGRPITAEDKEKICAYMDNIDNPYGIAVKFVWLDAEEKNLSSPVINGESAYIAAKVAKGEHCEEAFGYSFEKLVLFAWSLGIGTTWIGGTMDRKAFENAAEVEEGEFMMCVTPVGYPSGDKSEVDLMIREKARGDYRLPAAELFFEKDFTTPIEKEEDLLEAVRWYPSAANMQPCRIVRDGSKYHFYEKHAPGYAGAYAWDVQKVDMGIALCHFMSMAEGDFEICDPGIAAAEDTEYIATVICK